MLLGPVSLVSLPALANPQFGVAGVPMDQGKTRDYDAIFGRLAASGVDVFFPTFLYQQHPLAKSLGFEKDFGPECSREQPAFENLRRHGLKLLISADNLYSPTGGLPTLERDPLRAVIACADVENVLGVLSYDEPALVGVSVEAVRALYERVKTVAPGLTVYMVQAPLTFGAAADPEYFADVQATSKYADVVGFDVYPVSNSLAKVADPRAPETVLLGGQAVSAYMTLIRELAPGKRYLAVLQAFSYADQFSADALKKFPDDLVKKDSIGPTLTETDEMARAALSGGAEIVVWFGGAYTPKSSAPHWKAVMNVIERMAGKQ